MIKKNEIIPVKLLKDVAETARKNLELKMKTINLTKDPFHSGKIKEKMKKALLERKLIKNLEVKTYADYKEYIKQKSLSRVKLRKEFLLHRSDSIREEINIQNKNLEYQKKIDYEIHMIEKLEKKHQELYHPIRKRAVTTARKSICTNPKERRSIVDFVKLKPAKSLNSLL